MNASDPLLYIKSISNSVSSQRKKKKNVYLYTMVLVLLLISDNAGYKSRVAFYHEIVFKENLIDEVSCDRKHDGFGRFLILDVKVSDNDFLLINL